MFDFVEQYKLYFQKLQLIYFRLITLNLCKGEVYSRRQTFSKKVNEWVVYF